MIFIYSIDICFYIISDAPSREYTYMFATVYITLVFVAYAMLRLERKQGKCSPEVFFLSLLMAVSGALSFMLIMSATVARWFIFQASGQVSRWCWWSNKTYKRLVHSVIHITLCTNMTEVDWIQALTDISFIEAKNTRKNNFWLIFFISWF